MQLDFWARDVWIITEEKITTDLIKQTSSIPHHSCYKFKFEPGAKRLQHHNFTHGLLQHYSEVAWLTLIGREPVFSTSYGRNSKAVIFRYLSTICSDSSFIGVRRYNMVLFRTLIDYLLSMIGSGCTCELLRICRDVDSLVDLKKRILKKDIKSQ